MPDINTELERLRKENEKLKKALRKRELSEATGRRARSLDVPDNIKSKLFGVKVVDNEIVATDDVMVTRANCTTFLSNLVRALLPYPRYNKTNGWIANMPVSEMTDKEFKVCKKLVKDVLRLIYAAKIEIEQENVK